MLLDEIRKALRKTSTTLDDEILTNIRVARAEMLRAGVHPALAENPADVLVNNAIKDFCLWKMTSDEKLAERYGEVWRFDLDDLRKSYSYAVGGDYNCEDE